MPAGPCGALRRQARPRLRGHASPVHAVPCRSCGANPGLPSHACLALPSPPVHATPASRFQALPYWSCLQRHAVPRSRLASPHRACNTTRSHAGPHHACQSDPGPSIAASPATPLLAWQRHASPAASGHASRFLPCLRCRAIPCSTSPCRACRAVPCTSPTTPSLPFRTNLTVPRLPVLAASCRALQSHACKTLERRALPNLPCQFRGGSIPTATRTIRVTLSRTGQSRDPRCSCCRVCLRRCPPEDQRGKSGLLRRSW